MAGFSTLVDKEFGFIAKVINIPIIGIRHNKYSSCYGTIRYFNDKLALRGKEYNMFTKEELENFLNFSSKNMSANSLGSKLFEHSHND